ncbi:PREDICTED: cysteine-rich and transmembrane domain-containing protein A-like [Tarenaya hassleriana]|uniref:cysteine-rich and transmembrane domain-containing protein A-like n=1 Tax=Tarenaya hassleriana TaxID=28532 RepID=UPI00053C228D|nr:PREDICTED: cysteine-rich and transmembrane domain-containing protein A-like [Tarenaya hassleriana]
MNNFEIDHNQPSVNNPLPEKPPAPEPYTTPPPVGYPTRDTAFDNPPVETKSKGDGFWKGCCAGLCCCCLLDACF